MNNFARNSAENQFFSRNNEGYSKRILEFSGNNGIFDYFTEKRVFPGFPVKLAVPSSTSDYGCDTTSDRPAIDKRKKNFDQQFVRNNFDYQNCVLQKDGQQLFRRMTHSESAGYNAKYSDAQKRLTYCSENSTVIRPFDPTAIFMSRSCSSSTGASSSGFESMKAGNARHLPTSATPYEDHCRKNSKKDETAKNTTNGSCNMGRKDSNLCYKDFLSPSISSQCSSSVSLEKLDENQATLTVTSKQSGKVDVTAMMKMGLPDDEILSIWLHNLRFEEYMPMFTNAGYDLATISKMTPEDITAIGITKPGHRKRLTHEIRRLNIVDDWPACPPVTLREWLIALNLAQYVTWFTAQGFVSVEQILDLAWDDFEDIGVKKLGHLKKILSAIRKIKDFRRSGLKSRENSTNFVAQISPNSTRNSAQFSPDFARNSAQNFQQINDIFNIGSSGQQNYAKMTGSCSANSTFGECRPDGHWQRAKMRVENSDDQNSTLKRRLSTFILRDYPIIQDTPIRETDILCTDDCDENESIGSKNSSPEKETFEPRFGVSLENRNTRPAMGSRFAQCGMACDGASNFLSNCSIFGARRQSRVSCVTEHPQASSNVRGGAPSKTHRVAPEVVLRQPVRPTLAVKPCSVVFRNEQNFQPSSIEDLEPCQFLHDDKIAEFSRNLGPTFFDNNGRTKNWEKSHEQGYGYGYGMKKPSPYSSAYPPKKLGVVSSRKLSFSKVEEKLTSPQKKYSADEALLYKNHTKMSPNNNNFKQVTFARQILRKNAQTVKNYTATDYLTHKNFLSPSNNLVSNFIQENNVFSSLASEKNEFKETFPALFNGKTEFS